jgi:hypothetical protein
MVQEPALSNAEQVPLDVYPAGIDDSVAVQVGSGVKPETVNVNGVDSDTEAETGAADPLAQTRDTVTVAGLSSLKFLFTVKSSVLRMLTIVQEPVARSASAHVPEELYPVGIGASVAVQVGSPVNPVTVKTAGIASDARADAGEAAPEAHEIETVTLKPMLGWKSLLTVKLAVFSVLIIVHVETLPSLIPTLAQAAWFPVYPDGSPDSVAVQVAPLLKPVIVKLAGSASEAVVSSFATVPDVHVTEIVTFAALLSEKSLETSNTAAPSVLTIVQEPALIVAAQVPLET